jgi:two-component system cell cycle sensor histidine kinase/response regulator CckA
VLVVENEPAVRHVIDIALTRAGHDVLAAGSVFEAIALLLDFPAPPDVALLDLVMPGMGGLAYAEQLRRHFPRIRLVFITGWLDHPDVDHAAQMGLMLFKPFTPHVVRAAVERY